MEIDESFVNKTCAVLLIAGIALIAYSLLFGSHAQAQPIAGSYTTTRASGAIAAVEGAPMDFTPPMDGGMGMPPG